MYLPNVISHPLQNLTVNTKKPDVNTVLPFCLKYLNDSKTVARCLQVCQIWLQTFSSSAKVQIHKRSGVDKLIFEMTPVVDDVISVVLQRKNTAPDDRKYMLRSTRSSNEFGAIKFRLPSMTYYDDDSALVAFVGRQLKFLNARKGLSFYKCYISNDLLSLVAKRVADLTALRFWQCTFADDALCALHDIKSIYNFEVDHCYGIGNALSSATLLPIVKRNCIRVFELTSPEKLFNVKNDVIDALLTMRQNSPVQFFKLKNCPNITTSAISRLASYFSRNDNKKYIVHLESVGFNLEKFLGSTNFFKMDSKAMTSRRVSLTSLRSILWLEKHC